MTLFVIVRPSGAQNYPFREYTVLDGLPQSQATAVFQDSRGFLWITTRNGISRFDGIEFKNYFKKDGLPSNIITSLFEDSSGYIWALSSSGISKYDGIKFQFFPCPDNVAEGKFFFGAGPGSNDTVFILHGSQGVKRRRIISFNDGVYSDYSSRFPALDTMDIGALHFDFPARCFYLIDNNLNCWRWDHRKMELFSPLKFTSILADRGKIIFLDRDKRYSMSEGRLVESPLRNMEKRTEILKYKVGGEDFIRLFDGSGITDINLPFNSTGALIDNESNVWFSSERNLYRLISTAFTDIIEVKGLVSDIWALAEDKNGKMWMGSLFGGLEEYDGKIFRLRDDYRFLFGSGSAFYKGSIRKSDGSVYFSLNTGVLVWDGSSFSRMKEIPDHTQVCTIYEDPADRSLLFGTDHGVYHLKNGVLKNFPEFNSAGYGVIEGVLRIDEGKYLLSGEKGLVVLDRDKISPVRDTLLPGGYTFTMVKDKNGGIWVTSEEGLFFESSPGSGFRNGLPEQINTSANSIILMDTSRILVGRMKDICVIDIDKFYANLHNYYRIYDQSYGFSGSDCLDNGIIKDRNGKFWILTSGRIVIFDPDKVKRNNFPPKLHITGIDYLTDTLTWEPLIIPGLFYGRNNNILLTRKQNTIRISYTGISLSNPENVTYQHRLIGHDGSWSELVHESEVVYENLPPKAFTFELKAFNSDGIGSSTALNLRLMAAIRQTLVFKLLAIITAILFIAFVTWLIVKFYMKKKSEEEKIRSELARLQMNSVIRQFDPHFTFNVISSVGSLIMKGEKESAYDYILKLSGLLRSSLSDGSVMIRSLSDELDFVKKYCDLQKLRFKERFTCLLDLDDKVDLQREIPKMTIQTFVENSIKHGIENRIEGGIIYVKLEEIDNCLEITVRDNGIGRKAAEAGNTGGIGYGMKTMNDLFDFLNKINRTKARIDVKDLFDINDLPAGTEVKVIIPDDFIFEYEKLLTL